MNTPEIEELKSLVEKKYKRLLSTTTDFEEFSIELKRKVSKEISSSTLKRIWGYVNDSHKTRKFTLDILANYIGHENFDSFVSWLKTSTRYNSSFFNACQVLSSELAIGQQIEIGWRPNRLLRLKYLGSSKYEVIDAKNSKIKVGDRFITGCFIKGQPLILPFIERPEGNTSTFVAGRNSGLNMLVIIKEEK
ncbi:MAG: hypothetical protein ACI4B3_06600 [Prevotella sp.]